MSPRSVLDESIHYYNHNNYHHVLVGAKRKFPFDEPSASMNLRHRIISDETVEWLATKSSSKVEKLCLGPVFESSQTVLSAISTLPASVTHLDLDLRNTLHLLPLALPLLFSKRHIKTLSVRVFGDAGAIEVARWIEKNPDLVQLDLRGNRIGSLGARTILDALIACGGHKLSYLNLSCNCILHGDRVGQLLSMTNTLQKLDLAFNWLGDQDVEEICIGLRKNTHLRELNLFGCQRISNAGLRMMLHCLKYHNTSLHEVELQSFDEEGDRLLREINYWLCLNKAGRYMVKEQDSSHAGLWPLVFERSNHQVDSIFFLLREGVNLRLLRR
jgi:hypothetical protein